MLRQVDYIVLFVAVVLLQLFLFDNIQISGLLHINVYILFVIALPVTITPGLLLILAALSGVVIDFFSGTSGLATMSVVLMAFLRPTILRLFIGTGGNVDSAPVSGRIGTAKFLRYAFSMTLVYNVAFFMLESLSLEHFYHTLLRIIVSTAVSLCVIYFCQLPLIHPKERI